MDLKTLVEVEQRLAEEKENLQRQLDEAVREWKNSHPLMGLIREAMEKYEAAKARTSRHVDMDFLASLNGDVSFRDGKFLIKYERYGDLGFVVDKITTGWCSLSTIPALRETVERYPDSDYYLPSDTGWDAHQWECDDE